MSPGEATELLELHPAFSRDDLEAAYHRALAECHPSHFAEDEAALAEAMDRTLRINEAYQTLTHPAQTAATGNVNRLKLPPPPVLSEPTVEPVPPRILGRIRLPQPPVAGPLPGAMPPASAPSAGPSPSRRPPAEPRLTPPLASPPLPLPRPPPPSATHRTWRAWLFLLCCATCAVIVWGLISGPWHPPRPAASASWSAPPAAGGGFQGRSSVIPQSLSPTHQRAVAENDATAQRELGDAFRLGSGVPQDDQEAVSWYQRAADQGDPAAQRELGHALRDGRGVERNLGAAIPWYERAAARGDPEARQALEDLRR